MIYGNIRPHDNGRQTRLAVVLVAVLLRLVILWQYEQYRFPPIHPPMIYGGEMDNVAARIAMGQGFSSPYNFPTGPTAIVPHLYCYLEAGAFRLLGVFSELSGIVLALL